MLKVEGVQSVLNAFIGLLTQPFDQDLKASVKAAATSICLAVILAAQGTSFLTGDGAQTALDIGGVSMVLILVWMALTAILSPTDGRKLAIARNLSVVSFWIAVTLVVLLAVEFVFTDPLDRAVRLTTAWITLLVLIPIHMFRNLRLSLAFFMTLCLLVSTWGLAHRIIY